MAALSEKQGLMATDDAQTMAARVATNYSASATGYAEFWSPVIRPAGRRLLDTLPWDGASRVLDIGTGTGALIPDILRLAPAACVIGTDPSLGMLARARGTPVPLVAMDAMALGLRAGSFDVAVLAFVLFQCSRSRSRPGRGETRAPAPWVSRPDDVGRGTHDAG